MSGSGYYGGQFRISGGGDGSSEAGNYGPIFKPGCGPINAISSSSKIGPYVLGGTGKSGPFCEGGSGPYSTPNMASNDLGSFCWGNNKPNIGEFVSKPNPNPKVHLAPTPVKK